MACVAGRGDERGRSWVVEYADARFVELKVDFAVHLIIAYESNRTEVTVEMHGYLRDKDRSPRKIDVDDPTSLSPLLSLLRAPVRNLSISGEGELSIYFTDGLHLAVPPHEEYEAWGVVNSFGTRFVCMPGGSVAYWSGGG